MAKPVQAPTSAPAAPASSLKLIKIKEELAAKNAAAEAEAANKPEEIFTDVDEEAFKKIWTAYEKDLTFRRKSSMAPMINKILTQGRIEAKDNAILIKMDNDVLQRQFNEDKQAFYTFIKTKFQHPPVQVEYVVVPPTKEEERQYLVSDRDKFERMKEINPEVAKLKDILDLDIS